jgi:hypothetical protein
MTVLDGVDDGEPPIVEVIFDGGNVSDISRLPMN